MKPKSTNELNAILENTNPDQLGEYIKANRSDLIDGSKSFYYYMKDTLAKKKIRLKDVYSLAGVTESYGSKIITMEKHTTNRDLIIRFCIVGHFTKEETNKALKLYGFNELYPRDMRDACIISALNFGKNRLCDVDDLLRENNLRIITEDAEENDRSGNSRHFLTISR